MPYGPTHTEPTFNMRNARHKTRKDFQVILRGEAPPSISYREQRQRISLDQMEHNVLMNEIIRQRTPQNDP